MRARVALVGGALLLVCASGLSQPPAASSQVADVETRRARAVATFKGGAITIGMLEDAAQRSSRHVRALYRDPEHLKTLLALELRLELLAREAERLGYDKHAAVRDAVKRAAVDALLAQQVEQAAAEMHEKDMRAVMRVERDSLKAPQRRRASHIAVATREEATALIAQARKLDMNGFRKLAREKTLDEVSRTRGGDLGYFDARGNTLEALKAIPLALAKAAFALDAPGAIAPQPIKTPTGFSIVMLTGVQAESSRTPEQGRAQAYERLVADADPDGDLLVQQLQAQYEIETHPERLGEIELEVPANPEDEFAP